MSVARKTPKFAERSHSKTPPKQTKKIGPTISSYIRSNGSPFSNTNKAASTSQWQNPYSLSTLQQSIELLRQLNNDINSQKEKNNDRERTPSPSSGQPVQGYRSKIEAFLLSRKLKRDEDFTKKASNLDAKKNCDDIKSKVLTKETSPSHSPPSDITEKSDSHNKSIHNANERVISNGSPNHYKRDANANCATRGASEGPKMEEYYHIEDQYRSNRQNQYSSERSSAKKKEEQMNTSSYSSNYCENSVRKSSKELKRLKGEVKRNKSQLKDKIDFINSLYEELALHPREKPLLPSNRPRSPEIETKETKETPRSLRLVNDREIDESDSNRRKNLKKDQVKGSNKKEKKEPEFVTLGNKSSRGERPEEQFEQTISKEAKNGGLYSGEFVDKDDGAGYFGNYEKICSDKTLKRKYGGTCCKENRRDNDGFDSYSNYGNNGNKEREFYEYLEPKGEMSNRKKETTKPPLHVKKMEYEDSPVEYSDCYRRKSVHQSFSAVSQENRSGTKNRDFIGMNKNSSGTKNARYKNYEKVLRNVDQACGPLLEELRKVSSKPTKLCNTRCCSNKTRKSSPFSSISPRKTPGKSPGKKGTSVAWSPSIKDFSQFEATSEGLGSTMASIKSFYEEMNKLTLKITEAANVMQKTLDRLEQHKVEDYSARKSEDKATSNGETLREMKLISGSEYEEDGESVRRLR